MKIELYLDSLFLVNFMINWGILKLLQYKFALGPMRMRIVLAAIAGTGGYLLTFLGLFGSIWRLVFLQVISVLLMIYIMLPKRRRRHIIKIAAWGYGYSFIVAGILRAVLIKWQFFGGRTITILAVLVGVYFCICIGLRHIQEAQKKKKRSLCKVTIESAGAELEVTALVDTGNGLREPISKNPVCLMEEELLAKITLENPLFLRAIPFHSVGCEQGILYGVLLPKLTIIRAEEFYVLTDVICAGVNHKLSAAGGYQMILHPDLFTEEKCSEKIG